MAKKTWRINPISMKFGTNIDIHQWDNRAKNQVRRSNVQGERGRQRCDFSNCRRSRPNWLTAKIKVSTESWDSYLSNDVCHNIVDGTNGEINGYRQFHVMILAVFVHFSHFRVAQLCARWSKYAEIAEEHSSLPSLTCARAKQTVTMQAGMRVCFTVESVQT